MYFMISTYMSSSVSGAGCPPALASATATPAVWSARRSVHSCGAALAARLTLSSGCEHGWIMPFMSRYRLSTSNPFGLGLLVSTGMVTWLISRGRSSTARSVSLGYLLVSQRKSAGTPMAAALPAAAGAGCVAVAVRGGLGARRCGLRGALRCLPRCPSTLSLCRHVEAVGGRAQASAGARPLGRGVRPPPADVGASLRLPRGARGWQAIDDVIGQMTSPMGAAEGGRATVIAGRQRAPRDAAAGQGAACDTALRGLSRR